MTYYYKGEVIKTIPNPVAPSYRLMYDRRLRYATKPMGREPAPYLRFWAANMDATPQTWYDAPNANVAYNISGYNRVGVVDVAKDRALSKLKGKVMTASSELGTTLAEWRQSVDMIHDRAVQLRKAWQALRRGRFRQFKRYLGMDPKGPPSTKPADAAKLWLEYWFGWSPLVADIYESVNVLQSELPTKPVRARSGAPWTKDVLGKQSANWDWQHRQSGDCSVVIGCSVKVSNKNLLRANQLGLINPASIAWELVPFSFLVDWFIPVGQFLDGWTMWAGLSVEQPFTTVYLKGKGTQWIVDWTSGAVTQSQSTRAFKVERVLALPTYSWPLPKSVVTVSVTRAATAMSLLVGDLSKRGWIR